MDNGFYRAFEDLYRGSRELIKQRLNVYVPFVRPLLNIYDDCRALDLGCGRGEWLELTGEIGFNAHGVDLDEGMLKACLERGFSVETQDAIVALEHLPDESQAIVSAFHLAEHIPFDDLQKLVKEALRVLKPSGLLIIETPNSENLAVGTSSFYLDPTHQRPLPVQLLSFLCDYTGFQRTKILRLQQDAGLETACRVHLINVLSGVSPDCAVVAQKSGIKMQTGLFDAAFEMQCGLTLESLAARYDDETQTRLTMLEAKIQQAEAKAEHAEAKAEHAEAKAAQAEIKAAQAETKAAQAETKVAQAETKVAQAETKVAQAEARAQIAEARAQTAEARAQTAEARAQTADAQAQMAEARAKKAEISALQAHDGHASALSNIAAYRTSTSWRLTRPLRALRMATLGNPGLALMELGIPRNRVERLGALLMKGTAPQVTLPQVSNGIGHSSSCADLTPHARQIYDDLKLAIARHQEQ